MILTERFDRVKFPTDVIERAIEVAELTETQQEAKRQGYLLGDLRTPVLLGGYSVTQGMRRWDFGNLDEWLGEYGRGCDHAELHLEGVATGHSLGLSYSADSTAISAGAREKPTVERIMRVFTAKAPELQLPLPPEPVIEPVKPTVFIGHGGASMDWRLLKDELHDKHGYTIEAYETGARSGHSIRNILDSMLDASSFALVMMTGEDEIADGSMRARQNVVHEAGLFQGRLGFNRAIAVVEAGVEVFSNLDGVQHIPYTKGEVKSAVSEVLAVLAREFPGHR